MDNPFFDYNSEIQSSWRKLPHWDQEGKLQFVTFHLADSLPQVELSRLMYERKNWIKRHPLPWNRDEASEYLTLFGNKIDHWLDQGHGSCALRDFNIAKVIRERLYLYDGVKYEIVSYVVMPNHVHVLLYVFIENRLAKIMHDIKGYTAFTINKMLCRKGKLWHEESFDRIIRDEKHFINVIEYIERNIRQGGVLWKI